VLKRIDAYDPFLYWRDSWSAVIHTTGEEPYSKAIYALLDQYPHRIVDVEREFDIAYSIFSAQKDVYHHQKLYSSYTNQTTPLIQQKWPLSWLFALISNLRKAARKVKSWRSRKQQNQLPANGVQATPRT
jgi:hypothetical protein